MTGLAGRRQARPAFGRRTTDAAAPVAGALLPRLGMTIAVPAVAAALLQPVVAASFEPGAAAAMSRGALAAAIASLIDVTLAEARLWVDPKARRDLVSGFIADLLAAHGDAVPAALPMAQVLHRIHGAVLERIDSAAAARMGRGELGRRLTVVVTELLAEQRIQLNAAELRALVSTLLDDMLGLGPLEALLADDSINDIMVNGPKSVFVERAGRLEASPVRFRDDAHVMAVASRIVAKIGRRIDEASPLVDARLEDGSRVNIIIPPLAIDGPTISIRKFARKSIDLDQMARQGNLSPDMAAVLKVAAASRLNILVSGGTGSGKTTLLGALSHQISGDERIVTIEDAAELQLQQPHVVRLETRPANLEGKGEIGMRELVKNALRMRPDRIILGEIRGNEALDMLQAMNTGHDGSLGTIHANRPREALSRLENMIGMAGVTLPIGALRTQIAAAIHLIVQIARMRDGVRRITSITEVVGMEGDDIVLQELFTYAIAGGARDGTVSGGFTRCGVRPAFFDTAAYHGLGDVLIAATA
ncbi:MAG: CpaF family protein [Sandarakinorhabdus sp.]|nr:CpaF family protein [Sandarakinorhabdus sp.]